MVEELGVLIPLPAVEDLGPAMRACTVMQRKFVVAFYHTGHREKSAAMAGYAATTANLLGVSAHQVFHNPKVQEAIREFGRDNAMGSLIPLAFKAIEEALVLGDTKEKTKAAGMVFDRTGFHATQEIKVTKTVENRTDTIKAIIALAKEQGLDPRSLIGGAVDFVPGEDAKVVDAEFVEVSSLEGLEDVT